MLVLTRKMREKIRLSNGVTISIEGIKDNRVKIGIEAPKDIDIRRSNSCMACGRPTFSFYLDYEDLPCCDHPKCREVVSNNKSLFD